MLQIQGAVAELEHATITERMRRGLKHAVKNGQVIGSRAPYGYRHVPKSGNTRAHWEIDPQEAKIVKFIFDLYVHKGILEQGLQIISTTKDFSQGVVSSGGDR